MKCMCVRACLCEREEKKRERDEERGKEKGQNSYKLDPQRTRGNLKE